MNRLDQTTDYHGEVVKLGDTVFAPADTLDPLGGKVVMILPGLWDTTLLILESYNLGGLAVWWATDNNRCEKGKP